MPLLNGQERHFLGAISRLAYANPFLPERREAEREALGEAFEVVDEIRSFRVDDPTCPDPNRGLTDAWLEELLPRVRARLATHAEASEQDLALYRDAVWLLLYRRRLEDLRAAVQEAHDASKGPALIGMYRAFVSDWQDFFEVPEVRWRPHFDAHHVFACLFQIQHAFHHIFRSTIGSSQVAARLRADVWRSIFTHDMRRYRDSLYRRMHDATTLITGPSGTGKELVARAIGFSRYIPFDPGAATFAHDVAAGYHALNLSAMPSALIESELFGHKRGAFTGAVSDRQGWLEICEPGGTVFLDEIGELDPTIQVKLLRVLQVRTFHPVGEAVERRFLGKIIAATNRDLGEALHSGALREDFYYRLCSDVIVTPSLQAQLREAPEVLHELLRFIVGRITDTAADPLVDEVEGWIVTHLGRDYPWPGNFRELEQCVRNVLIRGEYRPLSRPAHSVLEETVQGMERGAFTADELLGRYSTLVYARTGSYQEAARRLQLDRRTVKSRVDAALLQRLRES